MTLQSGPGVRRICNFTRYLAAMAADCNARDFTQCLRTTALNFATVEYKFFFTLRDMWCLLPISPGSRLAAVIGGTRFISINTGAALSVPVVAIQKRVTVGDTHIFWWPLARNQNEEGISRPPFVVTPPLFMLSAREENSMRVVYTGGPLPADGERSFTLVSPPLR